MHEKVLVVDDEREIVNILKLYLEKDQFKVIEAFDGEEGFRAIENNKIDIAVLDIMMPKLNGFELVKKIRERHEIPIILLSAKQMDSDKVLGLDLGADDYVIKPFNPLEVVARIKAQLRRTNKIHGISNSEDKRGKIKVHNLILNEETFLAELNGEEISLTSTEYKILNLLMNNAGRIFTKRQLYEASRGEYIDGDENTLMVHISKLRDKIEEDPKNPKYLKTVRGLGYKIEKENNIN